MMRRQSSTSSYSTMSSVSSNDSVFNRSQDSISNINQSLDNSNIAPPPAPSVPGTLRKKQAGGPPDLPPKRGKSTATSDPGDEYRKPKLDGNKAELLAALDPQKPRITINRDLTFISTNVMGLNEQNFQEYLKSKEKALVYFYESCKPRKPQTECEFSNAADLSLHANYGFAAVDCLYDSCLCNKENICRKPMMKLYSNGFELSSLTDIDKFNTGQMQILMKMTPVLNKARFEPGKEMMQQPSPPTKKGGCFGNMFG